MASTSEAAAEREVRAAFAVFDEDKSGTITEEELTVILVRPVAGGHPFSVEEAAKLVGAPDWANGRDVDAWVRRIAVESATRGSSVATPASVRAATQDLLARKRGAVVVEAPPVPVEEFLTEDMIIAPPRVEGVVLRTRR